MKKTNYINLALLVMTGSFVLSCSKSKSSETESPLSNIEVNSNPFLESIMSEADSYLASVKSAGEALSAGRYTLTGDGNVLGTYSLSAGSVLYQRPDVAGPCTDVALTAPSCGVTWGTGSSGVYHAGDYNFFPNLSALSNEFQYLKYVQVDVRHELASGDLSGAPSDCGIEIGFGTAAGVPASPQASNNLRLPGRSSTNQDIVKFLHRYSSTGESLIIDAPLNNATDSSYTQWGLANFDASFNMSENSIPSVNGDYVDFRMWIVFDHVAKGATIRLSPLATNKTLSAMQTQTVTWTYNNPYDATSGGEARGGLMFGSGTTPLAIADFESSRASIGFAANGVSRKCGFSNLQIGTLKTLETVSTPFTF